MFKKRKQTQSFRSKPENKSDNTKLSLSDSKTDAINTKPSDNQSKSDTNHLEPEVTPSMESKLNPSDVVTKSDAPIKANHKDSDDDSDGEDCADHAHCGHPHHHEPTPEEVTA